MDKKSNADEQEALGLISEKRRRLLKTAAASAPVVATLQSGAAFANTSAYQCIADAATENPQPSVGANDHWLRVPVTRYQFKKPDSTVTDWWWDVDGVISPAAPAGTVLQSDTEPFYIPTDAGNGMGVTEKALAGWQVEAQEPAFVIIYFDPNADRTDAEEIGPYPKYLITYPTAGGDATPLNGSCFCSLNPNTPGCV